MSKQGPMGPPGGGPPGGAGRHGHGKIEKAKDVKGVTKRLLSFLKPQIPIIIVVIIITIASCLFSIVAPTIMGLATTSLFNSSKDIIAGVAGAHVDFEYIGKILYLLAGLYIVSALFSYLQQYIMVNVSQKVVYDMRKMVDEKLSRLPLKYFDRNQTGDILSKVTNDVDNISTTLQQNLTQIISSVITLIGILVMMLLISPVLTLINIIILPIAVLFTTKIAKYSQKLFSKQWAETGALNGHIEEVYTGHSIVKVFGNEKKSIGDFEKINDELYNVGWKAQFISGIIMPIMIFVNNLGYVLLCITGGIFVIKNVLLIGQIQAMLSYSRQFSQPITQITNIINVLQSAIASAERVFNLLDEPEEIPDSSDPIILDAPYGNVKFENVTFGYSEDNILINNMNIDIKSGQTIAIVGPTGAGKTTIVNLLMRFYELNGGRITIDGVNINDMKRGDLRNIYGMVLQDTWLFTGSVKENIKYGSPDATDEEMKIAAKSSYIDHFIKTLPQGYNTILSEDSTTISQGQKQLLTIARALLKNPIILILDEATSSVDTRTEVLIRKAMQSLMLGRTSFVIAHRLSTIRDADLILVMDNGSIIEHGNHQELLEKKGFYSELYYSQFAKSFLDD